MTTWEERMGPRPPAPAPRLELLETCWQLTGPTGKTITCGVYAVDGPGVEVRAGYSLDDFAKTQRVADVDRGRELAGEWKAAAIAKGFTEVTDCVEG